MCNFIGYFTSDFAEFSHKNYETNNNNSSTIFYGQSNFFRLLIWHDLEVDFKSQETKKKFFSQNYSIFTLLISYPDRLVRRFSFCFSKFFAWNTACGQRLMVEDFVFFFSALFKSTRLNNLYRSNQMWSTAATDVPLDISLRKCSMCDAWVAAKRFIR